MTLTVWQWILVTLVVAVTALYVYFTSTFGYFKKKGIPFVKPYPVIGSFASLVLQKKSIASVVVDFYNQCKNSRLGGFFEFRNPIVVIRDPELIKAICIKDFDHFVDHRKPLGDNVDELFENTMFSLTGERWRNMRATLSPAFTGSKIRNMFLLVTECGKQLTGYLEDKVRQHKEDGHIDTFSLELKDLFTRFANDVIATAAFGISCNSLKDPNNDFYKYGKDLTNPSAKKNFIAMVYMIFPKLMKMLGFEINSSETRNFFHTLVQDAITTREREGIIRSDMIHLLMQARRGELHAEVGEEDVYTTHHDENSKSQLTDNEITSQVFLFFLAGFETISTLLCFVAHILAVHPDIQEKIQAEIESTKERYNNKLTYEGIQELKYLDMVISETLRMYPPAVAAERLCTKSYIFPGSEVEVEKGTGVWIPIYALQHDPEYFPNPEKFDPERFSNENKSNIKPFTYLPFGIGPRNCIGMRFALMEAKVCLVHILSSFNLQVVEKTSVPLVLSKKKFSMTVDDGFWVGFEPRNNVHGKSTQV